MAFDKMFLKKRPVEMPLKTIIYKKTQRLDGVEKIHSKNRIIHEIHIKVALVKKYYYLYDL